LADMKFTMLSATYGLHPPEDALQPKNYDWKDKSKLEEALKNSRRPRARGQSTSTLHRTATVPAPARTTRRAGTRHRSHRQADIPKHVGYWSLTGGNLTQKSKHTGRSCCSQRSDDEAADVERHPRND
jgi:hypothetical protein